MNNLEINQEFKELIPPLTSHEMSRLEEDIKFFGCHTPIITWKGYIIDGHHRYSFCQGHGLSFKVEERQFEDEIAVKRWMIKNQSSRRNLSVDIKLDLAFKDFALEQKQSKQRQISKLKQFQDVDEKDSTECTPVYTREDEGRTLKKIAEKAGCGHMTAFQYKKIIDAGMTDRIKKGDSIKKVYDDLRREKAQAEVKKTLESIEIKEIKASQGVYDVVVIDPPWPMKKINLDVRPNQADVLDYPTMSLDEIKQLDIPCADDCHVFLWTTQKFLFDARDIIESWGLNYIWMFVWHKDNGFKPFGLPKSNCEFVLYARRGSPKFVYEKGFFSCFHGESTKHSEKPEEFYDVLRQVTAGRRLDMFNRREIDGFDGWGNEAAV